jgi:16S rRNA (adenine1518-N6/adenine1519-N6)-dimethyltransferase
VSESLKEQVIRKLQELEVSPKRSLGQNFLIGPTVIARILKKVELFNPESLVEVGPGLGALTEGLIRMQRPFFVLELDRVYSQYWRDRNVDVKEGDALRFNWIDWKLQSACLVSNLPYQISSSLVIDRSIEPAGVSSMVLMFQKEVAQRLVAQPKSKQYGLLTVIAQAAWSLENVLEAGPNEFYPPPNVASRVLSFSRRPDANGLGPPFLQLVKFGFSQRRKLLLSNLEPVYKMTGVDRNAWEVQLASRGYLPTVRAEEVQVDHWIELYRHFFRDVNGH